MIFLQFFFAASTTLYLTPCVKVVVLGFFSLATDVCKELLHYPASDSRPNFIEANDNDMYEHLVQCFSAPGSFVLDLSGQKGRFILAVYPCKDLLVMVCILYTYRSSTRNCSDGGKKYFNCGWLQRRAGRCASAVGHQPLQGVVTLTQC